MISFVLGRRLSLSFFLCVLFPFAAMAQHATGLKPETPDGKAWLKDHFKKSSYILPNSISLARTNAERRRRRLPSLRMPVAQFGAEAVTGKTALKSVATADLPASVDNSTMNSFPPIRSQGSLGSCVAWATTYYQATHEWNLIQGLSAKTGDNNYIFSPKWTYNIINGGEDGGAAFYPAYLLLTQNGAARWAAFPYDTNYRAWSLNSLAWRDAMKYRVRTQSGQITANTDAGMLQAKQMLANGHILVFGTYINSWYNKAVGNDPSTTLDDAFPGQVAASYMTNTQLGGHAMTIVGYNDNIWVDINSNGSVDGGEKGAFKIANSWGASWGNSGFVWISYDAFRATSSVGGSPTPHAGIAQGGQLYWITPTPYTPKLVGEFTINHARRGEMMLAVGIGSVGNPYPVSMASTGAFYWYSGYFGFDGSTNGVDGTFSLDLTDVNPNPVAGVSKRYFLWLYDYYSGAPLTLKNFKLLDGSGNLLATSSNGSQTVDASSQLSYIDYAIAEATPTSTPTSTATPLPTSTPTATPTATSTPLPTATSIPTSTPTPIPSATATPVPTSTPIPTATSTPMPTATFTPSPTSAPTLPPPEPTVIPTVTPAPTNIPVGPTARGEASPDAGEAPLDVTFKANLSKAGSSSIVSYRWEFGDNTTAEGISVQHRFTKVGTYAVRLTVTDNNNLSSATIIGIVVEKPDSVVAPTKLIVTGYRSYLRFTWRDNSNDESGFYLERAPFTNEGTGSFKKVASVRANVRTLDIPMSRGSYIYRLRAFRNNPKATSAPSNQIRVRIS